MEEVNNTLGTVKRVVIEYDTNHHSQDQRDLTAALPGEWEKPWEADFVSSRW